jgi:hypothetical protein
MTGWMNIEHKCSNVGFDKLASSRIVSIVVNCNACVKCTFSVMHLFMAWEWHQCMILKSTPAYDTTSCMLNAFYFWCFCIIDFELSQRVGRCFSPVKLPEIFSCWTPLQFICMIKNMIYLLQSDHSFARTDSCSFLHP